MNILNLYECMKNGKFYFTNILNDCALFNCLEVFGYVSTDHAAVGDEEKKMQTVLRFYSCGVLLSDCSWSMAWKKATQHEGISVDSKCPRCNHYRLSLMTKSPMTKSCHGGLWHQGFLVQGILSRGNFFIHNFWDS